MPLGPVMDVDPAMYMGRRPRRRARNRGAMLAGANVRPREYFDVDAPQNNRAVLDYGDL